MGIDGPSAATAITSGTQTPSGSCDTLDEGSPLGRTSGGPARASSSPLRVLDPSAATPPTALGAWLPLDRAVRSRACSPRHLLTCRLPSRSSLQHRGRSAKSSGNTERFPRTLKEELVWLDEWISPAASSVAGRAARATSDIWHSALRYPLARGLRKGRLNRIGSVTITE
jgi:hypothetical protein